MSEPNVAINPILPGFHPDPSICRVGDDFYLVTSTFEYFPGLPIHHSRDLVNWRPIGHVMDRPEQLPLDGVRASGGLYAPTIRWHDGTFYVVCTLVGEDPGGDAGVDTGSESGVDSGFGSRRDPAGGSKSTQKPPTGNFVVTATDAAGPWSNPVWLGERESFDPSLLFDDEQTWFCATRLDPAAPVPGGTEIWVQAFDMQTLALTGEQHVIWHGALVDAVWAEAPHLYRVGDSIVLVIAEGGTAEDHSVTCARAELVTGPYRNNPRNPILTHRHLGMRYPVIAAGHADLVEAADGTWWAVALAVRPRWGEGASVDDGPHYVLGRESFLAEVIWEGGWPVINPGVGALRDRQIGSAVPRDGLPRDGLPPVPERDDFDRDAVGPGWSFVRTPRTVIASLTDRPGWLTLYPQQAGISDRGCPGFLCRPQDSWTFSAAGILDFAPRRQGGDVAGLVLRQNDDFSLQLLITDDGRGGRVAQLIRRRNATDTVAAQRPVPAGPLVLSVVGRDLVYEFAIDDVVLGVLDGRTLSTTVAGGFVGTMLGPYVFSSDGGDSAPVAQWDWFDYRPG